MWYWFNEVNFVLTSQVKSLLSFVVKVMKREMFLHVIIMSESGLKVFEALKVDGHRQIYIFGPLTKFID